MLIVLTTYIVYTGPLIREAIIKTIRLHIGRNLHLMVFDPDISPTPDGVINSLSSDETLANRQDPPYHLLGVGKDRHTY